MAPQNSHPGVYIQEIPSGIKPIQAVETSIAAVVGSFSQGPITWQNVLEVGGHSLKHLEGQRENTLRHIQSNSFLITGDRLSGL